MTQAPARPRLLGMLEKKISGDDALLELTRRRLQAAGIGGELYPTSPEHLRHLLRFRPGAGAPLSAHLPRDIDVMAAARREGVLEYARAGAGSVFALVLHDQPEAGTRTRDYVDAVAALDADLRRIPGAPRVHVEYAVGLRPGVYLDVLRQLSALPHIGACLDVGHLGMWLARAEYARLRPGEEVTALTPYDPRLPERVDDVAAAVASALPPLLEVVRAAGTLGMPVHMHLHDGHPLWPHSQDAVSDHVSFFEQVPIPFEHVGRRSLPTLFGPEGLGRILAAALETTPPERLSMTLEIHPTEGRAGLGEEAELFGHWRDKTNAERVSYWMQVLAANARLVREAVGQPEP